MEETQSSIFEEEFKVLPRKALLPWWIKACNWLFMIFGGFILLILFMGLAGMDTTMAFYGLSNRGNVLTPTGLLLTGIMLFKGITAYGLWAEKDWGVNVAMADAAVGILICIYTMIALPSTNGLMFNFRLELILLFFFLRKLLKIREEWDSRAAS